MICPITLFFYIIKRFDHLHASAGPTNDANDPPSPTYRLRAAPPGVVRVPPPDRGGAGQGRRLSPPEPVAGGVHGGAGVPRGVGGSPEPVLQRRHRSETVAVPASAALSRGVPLFSSMILRKP